jgi:hypothetical protein
MEEPSVVFLHLLEVHCPLLLLLTAWPNLLCPPIILNFQEPWQPGTGSELRVLSPSLSKNLLDPSAVTLPVTEGGRTYTHVCDKIGAMEPKGRALTVVGGSGDKSVWRCTEAKN